MHLCSVYLVIDADGDMNAVSSEHCSLMFVLVNSSIVLCYESSELAWHSSQTKFRFRSWKNEKWTWSSFYWL